MVCQACGSEMSGGEVRFCPKCGAQIVAPAGTAPQQPPQQQYAGYPPQVPYPLYPPMVVVPRVQRHLQTLGTLWCIYGLYRVVAGLIGVFVFRTFVMHRGWWGGWGGPWGHYDMHGPAWMGLLPVIVTMTVLMAALAVFEGMSLLRRKPWGRVLGIVLAIFALFKFPVGTALGIYTLWVLAPGVSGMEYDALSDRS